MPTFGLFIDALFLAFAFLWCRAVFHRFHDDVKTLRESPDFVAKGVVILFWLLTLLVILWVAYFIWSLVLLWR